MCAHILVIDSIKQPDGYIAFKNSNSDFFEILIISLINKKSKKIVPSHMRTFEESSQVKPCWFCQSKSLVKIVVGDHCWYFRIRSSPLLFCEGLGLVGEQKKNDRRSQDMFPCYSKGNGNQNIWQWNSVISKAELDVLRRTLGHGWEEERDEFCHCSPMKWWWWYKVPLRRGVDLGWYNPFCTFANIFWEFPSAYT